ncbi:MAG: TonB-dependent receptor plug domain-containing protein [Chitinophagaceae bacterium]|nr:TonB-dependent receptor plug domain-containing protein [Chitinophagaceae bacterium]
MKQNLLLIFILFFSLKCFSQFDIKGKIIDSKTNLPIESALISFYSNFKEEKLLSDERGVFVLSSKQEKDSIEISSIGYEKKIVEILAHQETIIALEPKAVSLTEVIVSSSNFSKYNTLAKVDLKLKPVVNSQELLRIVPGLFIAQHAGGGKAEQIFLRGFDIDHGTDINITVDGMPVNMVSHAHGQGYADAHFIIPETVNNIDFGTGPYYANQGNLNTAGYVAFSTHQAISKSFIQTEFGGFNTSRTVAMIDILNKTKHSSNAYIAGEFYYFDGPTIQPQQLNRFNIFSKYSTAISKNTNLSISASVFKSKWNASGQLPARVIESGMIDRFGSLDPTEGGNTERYNFNVIATQYFKKNQSLNHQFYYTKYKFNLYSNFTFFLNDTINGDAIQQSENRNIVGYNSKYSTKNYFKNIYPFVSEYSVGFRYDDIKDNNLSKVVRRNFLNYVQQGDIKELNSYAYTSHQIQLNKLSIGVGVRVDYFNFNYFNKLEKAEQLPELSKAIFSPKFNLQYTFNPTLQTYLKLGKGFHSNDTRVVTANNGKEILPAAYGVDLGFVIKPIPNLYVNVALWYLHSAQEFVYVGDEGVVEPSGRSTRRGIDLITRYQISKNIFFNNNFNYAYSRALDEKEGENFIPLAPTFTASGSLQYKKLKGFNAGLHYRTIANRSANEDKSIIAKGYFLVDASIAYTTSKFELGLIVENIFNSQWNEAQFATTSRLQNEQLPITELNFTPGNPRFLKFKISYNF